ncbi:MAG: tetraacyldisaccharide 4'-kinase [Epsilonproteobacteria bacterium]|nr:tetraacyldisaccharide 4'-kinase [Campylobacterota bacterium]
MRVQSIVHSDNIIIKLFLRTLSAPYSAATAVRNHLYDKKIFKSHNLPRFCIGVGNIVAGGTGKTPFVIWLAERLKADGITAGVVTNGYGGRKRGEYLVSDGKRIFMEPPEAQDEAYLIATHKIPVASGINRLKTVELLGDADCIIMDDSFQYRKIKKDIEILILGKKPFDNGYMLPAGLLRENISGMKRADMILSRTALKNNNVPVFQYKLSVSHPISSTGQKLSANNLERPITAFCAIADPENFFNDLVSIGINPDKTISFPDHHIYSRKEINKLRKSGASLITTEKDRIKLGKMKNLYILRRKVDIKPDIYKIIKEQLMQAIKNE